MRLRLVTLGMLCCVLAPAPAPAAAKEISPMNQETPAPTLGYVILYVRDVAASLAFYEKAFGLSRRFFHDDEGKAYGELETGGARLAFASLKLVEQHLPHGVSVAAPDKPPLGFEVALVTSDVAALYGRAVSEGAASISAPEVKPWGQTVAYVRDRNGFLVELCSPLP